MIVAIHQPNFFPWLGYFDKIVKSDVFIFLDHVQFPRSSKGVWSNRVKILISGQPKWLTAPVDRSFTGVRAINHSFFKQYESWREKIVKTISTHYRKAPYFRETMNTVDPLIKNEDNNIASYNSHAVIEIARKLDVSESIFYRSSRLAYQGNTNEMLISLVKSVDGHTYMCGGGAEGYQDDNLFKQSGVRLQYQDFKHPQYEQFNIDSFIPGLSIIDALMNCGFSGVKELLYEK